MATVEKRKSGGSSKTSKKVGNDVKALAAEEEARRREVLKEKLREKLELERRALTIVERLMEDSVAEDFLLDCAKFITPDNYKDAVEERSIAKLCGYPICSNKLGKIPTQQYKISTKTNKVYDITERKCFCSNICYKASKEFELQLSKTPLWLRQHDRPPDIKLMKKGDSGSSGEEVILSERCLQEKDVENPLTDQPKDPHSSQPSCVAGGLSHSDGSDIEQEQEFVSSVISQRQGPRVHWGDLPKRTDADENRQEKPGKSKRKEKQNKDVDEEKNKYRQHHEAEKEGKARVDEKEKDSHEWKTDTQIVAEHLHKKINLPEENPIVETTAKMNLCSLSETVTDIISLPVDSTAAHMEHNPLHTCPPLTDSESPAENKPLSCSALTNTCQNSHSTTTATQLNITQVGMSKKGAAGLRDLLKNHTAPPKPESVNLLEGLRRTLKEWRTAETLKFLYGAHHSTGTLSADIKEEEEEELDEDDLEEEVTEEDGAAALSVVLKKPSAVAPDYGILKKETEQLELRVREFYKGTWVLPEEEAPNENKVTSQDQGMKEPVLPLIDSHAQHLIQKRIAVEKLTGCLRTIVGPLHLTMSDVSDNLNTLVRTFRLTNTNIIHKTPEWTLIAVLLLHLLSEVSPVVREALEATTSTEYLNTLMQELDLKEDDLLNLIQAFKNPSH
ncbi:hypothetical protein JOB18_033441 [Solea senegalensis]|uniref:RNA polymerase II subunit B1 CTD phosphatase RPAP2 homolog n=1 Tax=Solea senegalensis TaxID=28829 RepID=A0AAV6T8Y8_SOLSE|nr:putative RNA polymerase II subunit B1 CTD phosphatase rpap2 isoform X1 [Solea senegalensis]KAG7525902.1 hypothetical protein JOB18_033441 [Solea senegalensis]